MSKLSVSELQKRSGGTCELCQKVPGEKAYDIPPDSSAYPEGSLWLCNTCCDQVDKKLLLDKEYWRFLSDTMWSELPEVQVVSWRMLQRLKEESWAADCLDMLYMDDEMLAWAKATGDQDNQDEVLVHKDSNGQILKNGDTVVLTRSLDVKGTSLNAKMGTVVKNIRLVEDNTDQIEGKIEGQVIVILTKYVRKQGA